MSDPIHQTTPDHVPDAGKMIQQTTATGSPEEAVALLKACGLSYTQATVGVGDREWFVMIYEHRKRPPIKTWLGWRVRYMLGGGPPRAYAAWGERAPT